MKNLRLALVCALACSIGSGFAADTKKPKKVIVPPFMTAVSDEEQEAIVSEYTKDLKGWTDAELDAYVSQPASKFDRKVAQTGDDLGNQLKNDKEFSELREMILSLRTGDDVAKALEGLTDEKYAAMKSNNAKLVALELAQLKPLRGIIFRLVKLADDSRAVHSVLLTRIMKIATRIGIYQPTTQAPAVFQYLTQPYAGVTQFKTEAEFQSYVLTDISKAFEKSRIRLAQLNVSTPLIIDNELAYHSTDAAAHFANDSLYRYNLFQEGEKRLLLALKSRTLKNQMVFVSFNVKGLIKMVKEVGKLSGLDGFALINPDIDGVPTARRVAEIREFDDLFRFKPTPGKTTMYNAAFYNAEMVANLVAARAALGNDKGVRDASRIFNMAAIEALTGRMDKVLDVWKAMIRGRTPLVSKRSGEKIFVDVPAFYDMYSLRPDHPAMKARKPGSKDTKDSRYETVWDSKNFMPTQFVGYSASGKPDEKQKTIYHDGIEYRNYEWGMPIGWNAGVYGALFPGVTAAKVGDYQRILKESDGGKLVANLIDWVID